MPQAPAQSGAKSVEGANIRSPPWLYRCQVPPKPGTVGPLQEGHMAAVQRNLLLL